MKRVRLLIALSCLACLSVSQAEVSVVWQTGSLGFGGVIVRPGGSFGDASTWVPQGSVAQLIWTPGPDGTIDTDPVVDISAMSAMRADDVVLLTSMIGEGTGSDGTLNISKAFDATDYGFGSSTAFVGGYVFWRVFDYLLPGGVEIEGEPTVAYIPAGTDYADGTYAQLNVDDSIHMTPTPLGDTSIGNTPSNINMVYNGIDENGVQVLAMNMSVVPEPGTILFILAGVATLAFRRLRRRT